MIYIYIYIIFNDDWLMIVGDKDDTFGIVMIHSRTPVLFANQYAWNDREVCYLWLNLDYLNGRENSCHKGGTAKQNHEYS